MPTEGSTALVEAAQHGDQTALDRLISSYMPLVYNIVGRALAGHPDTDDVVQETFLRVVDCLPELRDPSRFRPWVVAIAMNQVRRRRQSPRSFAGPLDDCPLSDPGADFVDLTIIRLGLSEQRREVVEATRWLDPNHRELLALWWLEAAGQLTRADLAEALELHPEHAAVAVQRMKAQLDTARVVVRALASAPRCPELAVLTCDWDGVPSALWRKRIARHARECAGCGCLRDGMVPAEGLLAGMALVPLPSPGLAGVHGAAVTGPLGAVPAGRAPSRPAGQRGPGSHRAGGHRARAGAAGGHRKVRSRWLLRTTVISAGVSAAAIAGVLATELPGSHRQQAALTQVQVAVASGGPTSLGAAPSPSASATPRAEATTARARPSAPASTARRTSPAAAPTGGGSAPAPSSAPSSPSAHPSPPAVSTSQSAAQQVLALINSARAAQGLPALTETPGLEASAAQHDNTMADGCGLSHQCPGEPALGARESAQGVQWTSAGENIGEGGPVNSSSAEASMAVGLTQGMLDEKPPNDGHRLNILSSSFTHIGISVIRDSSGTVWLTQDFSD
ncbi:sigma-70 family RNA polymerase sigma factor [Streptacidiphilus sp. PB12-B1b]|uniref:sigma-70 family RNA polymerase sigma factor n=1 Tax=Streptacidiphilus sp. PB12-B1b TaxID=2705012 RepID=UPI0015FB9B35|nr:sigma-70 family RNA polymerase sigma factor [Streptacidiphilus sp. PB12-B1b]QMU77906.1 sigma-70 family RNA polymerase sigma factor [Streptacidiphilus sp. PB12-B1b]